MQQFDYNLLNTLEVLLEEQSVTSAALRLHLSQSAVSKQLAKLREVFGDPLFERTSYGLRATPRAKQLAPELRQVLQHLELFTRPQHFEPSESQRTFDIHMVEPAYSLTYPHFMPEILKQAPQVNVHAKTWRRDSLDQLLRCEIDMAISCWEWDSRSKWHMENIPNELNYVELVKDHAVCLVREEHPLFQEKWGLDTFLKYRHLQVVFGGIEQWLLDDILNLEHLKRDIAVNLTDFHSAMELCEHSDLILCAPAKYVGNMLKGSPLKILSAPVEMEAGCYVLMWHKHFDFDHSHRWFRELIIDRVKAEY
ncbi:LysR family transcriptional regulator [Aliivibrio sifiae]|uniref:LysR family transcriptional regulator n=1 Tax=Aliivibrio sifiae TaxID=566293 RepID=A0A2S7X6F1_9GAMM|nr:LysR family transcriptional regulator [Aliivibrio sifiae]PQJ86867.1 LysR family transcriptional regulator [Aliivibrio sifiae]GLR74014.1 LysR family transcriptional regulator [Aliivibrio sifiae]